MSELALRALGFNQFVTTHLGYTKFLVTYDFKEKCFKPESDHWKLKWFYVCWILLTLILWPLATLYVLIYQGVFYPATVTANRLFFTLILSAPMVLCDGMNWSIYNNRHEICQYLNLTIDLNEKLGVRSTHNTKSTKEILLNELKKLMDKKQHKNADLVGLFMVISIFYFAIIPILYIPAPFVLTIDPFSYPVQSITQYDTLPHWLYIPLRMIPAIGANICCMETARSIRTVFLQLIYAAKTTANLLHRIKAQAETDVFKAMELYKVMYAVHVKSMRPAGMLLFYAIEGGMFIAITTLSGTFIGWKILSPVVYWMNPMMATLTMLIIAIALPCAAYTADLSIRLVNQWKFRIDECKRGNRKLNMRTLRSFQPMAFYMSGFGYLLSDMKSRMFETIVMNTVDTVMMANDFAG